MSVKVVFVTETILSLVFSIQAACASHESENLHLCGRIIAVQSLFDSLLIKRDSTMNIVHWRCVHRVAYCLPDRTGINLTAKQ